MAIKQVSAGSHHILTCADEYPQITPQWFDPRWWQEKGAVAGQAKGRGTTLFLDVDGDALVLRHYRRGGLPGKLLDDQYVFGGLEATRPFKELRLLSAMCDQGLNVPRPVAAHVQRSGLVYRGDLITAMIPESQDLHAVLCRQPLPEDRWFATGVAVARMHRAGVYHHDLNVRNVMIDSREEIWIIDFDRCDFRAGDKWKTRNVARFLRSLVKEKNKHAGFHWQQSDWNAFLEGLQSV